MLEVLRSEIERLFDEAELAELCRSALGLDPAEIAPSGSKGAVAAGLVERYARSGALVALCDALAAARPGLDPRLRSARCDGFVRPEAVAPGTVLGPCTVEGPFGESAAALVLVARQGDARVRLRLIRRDVEGRRGAVERFLTAARLVAAIANPRLPPRLFAGAIGDRVGTLHDLVVGLPLTMRMAEAPAKLRDAWPVLQEILIALSPLHRRGLAHGALHARNVLQREQGGIVLLDAGAHYLYEPGRALAPEQVVGGLTTPASDVYAFGVLLYAMLSGRMPFAGTDREVAAAMLGKDPEPLSFVAPRGWIADELDELVLRMLDKDPAARPPNADALLDILETVATYSARRDSQFPEVELDTHIAALLDNPADATAASVLEAAVDQGAAAARVGATLRLAAEQLDGSAEGAAARRRLLMRSGVLFERGADDPEAAEQSYRLLLGVEPRNEAARAALERVLRRLGKYDAVVELYVEQTELAPPGLERARVFATLGELLATTLRDTEQAIVAYTHAVIEAPVESAYAEEIERLAGSNEHAFQEVLATCFEAVATQPTAEGRNALLGRMGEWYGERVGRPDLALRCFQTILMTDPAHTGALSELAKIYRRAHQWRELVEVLRLLADAKAAPAAARDLRAEAAEILETRLSDSASAAETYEQILADDAANERAGAALARLYLELRKMPEYERVQRVRLEAHQGSQRAEILCEVGRVREDRARDLRGARAAYEQALSADPNHIDALRHLERLYLADKAYAELLPNLERQVALAVTSDRKIELLGRLAKLHEHEFQDRDKAILSLERILQTEPSHEVALEELARLYRSLAKWPALAWTFERHVEQLREPAARAQKLLSLARLMQAELGEAAGAVPSYEAVLAIDPGNAEALDALADLRSRAGGPEAASAVEALAAGAGTQGKRAEILIRAGHLLEQSGDVLGAIERYRRALEAAPTSTEAASRLREALVTRGDVAAVVEMLEKDITRTTDDGTRGRLGVELSRLLRDRLSDAGRAAAVASRALEADPSNLEAVVLLADLERHGGRTAEALRLYDRAVLRLEALPKSEAIRVLTGRAETRGRSADPGGALADAELLASRFAGEPSALSFASRLFFEYGPPERAEAVAGDLLQRFGPALSSAERAGALYHQGRSLIRLKRGESAVPLLEEAANLDPQGQAPLQALAGLYRERGAWLEVTRVLARLLHRVDGDARAAVLVEMGDLAAETFQDSDAAARSYLAALGDGGQDRRILMKLVQLYSKDRSWAHLVDVILRLSKVTENPAQRAQHLQTAARIAAYEVLDLPRGIELIDEALAANPTSEALLRDAVELRSKAGDTEGIRRLLERQIDVAARAQDRPRALELATELADLHLSQLQVDDAIAVNEAALALDPSDHRREAVLADLYAGNPVKHLRRAVSLEMRAVRRDPFRPESYEAMKALYERAGNTDGRWCACRALTLLHRAGREEELFYRTNRSGGLIPGNAQIAESDWGRLVAHPDQDPIVSAIFAQIQPTVLAARGESLAQARLRETDVLDLANEAGPMARAIRRGAALLRMSAPLVYQHADARSPVALGRLQRRALVVGRAALGPDVVLAEAAFVAGAHLAYFRPGLYVRTLLSSVPALKAWMLAAVKLVAPRLPVPPDLEGLTEDALRVLSERLPAAIRDRLAHPVSELARKGGKADVGGWVAGVDLTSDRVGFVVSDDLETAIELIQRSGDRAAALPVAERVRQLFAYSMSPEYLELRTRLGIGIGPASDPSGRTPEDEQLDAIAAD